MNTYLLTVGDMSHFMVWLYVVKEGPLREIVDFDNFIESSSHQDSLWDPWNTCDRLLVAKIFGVVDLPGISWYYTEAVLTADQEVRAIVSPLNLQRILPEGFNFSLSNLDFLYKDSDFGVILLAWHCENRYIPIRWSDSEILMEWIKSSVLGYGVWVKAETKNSLCLSIEHLDLWVILRVCNHIASTDPLYSLNLRLKLHR